MTDRDRNTATDATLPLRPRPDARPAGTLELPGSDQVAAPVAYAPGEMIGRFEITGRLGEGGMGVVLAGRDPALGRRVAIKVLHAVDANLLTYRDRLLREARALALLDHANVIRIYEVGNDRDRVFVAMELVDGTTLTEWARAARRPWREVTAMFVQAGRGLAAVHHAGLVHRDFKPENVLVDVRGHVRVADFGLARLDGELDASASLRAHIATLTHTGMRLGTPRYMAPEQVAGLEVDARADQYAFCVALREVLLRWPEHGAAPTWRDTATAIRDALERGLAQRPEDRFASMDELLAVLEAAVATRSKRALVYVGGALAVAGGLAALALAWPAGEPTRIQPSPPPAAPPTIAAITHAPPVPVPQPAPIPTPPPPRTAMPMPPKASAATPTAHVTKEGAKANVDASATISPREQVLRGQEAYEHAISSYDAEHQHLTAGASATFAMHPTPFTTAKQLLYPPVGFTPNTPRTLDRYDVAKAHLDAVRTAIAELGRAGITITGSVTDDDVRELRATLDAADTDIARAQASWGLGVALRVRADYSTARRELRAGQKLIAGMLPHLLGDTTRDQLVELSSRIELNLELCDLAEGRGIDVAIYFDAHQLRFESQAERDEVSFVHGIAKWETGLASGKDTIALVANRNATLRPAITAYARAVRMIP